VYKVKFIFRALGTELAYINLQVLQLGALMEVVSDINDNDEQAWHAGCNPIAVDPRSKALLEMSRKAAMSHATVLICGDTGVGKEVLAHYIHQHSSYVNGPFVSINCAALPEHMIESMLFGYEKGAFTNALHTYIGKFEQAQNGSLLLDEISEISIALQAKLLRVLQEREIERLGGKKLIKINVRIIAATNRDLREQVAAGQFRKDLYYRLNVLPIHCLALKDRPQDIVPLAEYFLHQHAYRLNRATPQLTAAAKRRLTSAPWPGNVREMDNVMQRTLILNEKSILDEQDIVFGEEIETIDDLFSSMTAASEAKLILATLKETGGCRNLTASKLRMSSRTLRHKLSKLRGLGLDVIKK
jgi:two-component system, response regulator FlrC